MIVGGVLFFLFVVVLMMVEMMFGFMGWGVKLLGWNRETTLVSFSFVSLSYTIFVWSLMLINVFFGIMYIFVMVLSFGMIDLVFVLMLRFLVMLVSIEIVRFNLVFVENVNASLSGIIGFVRVLLDGWINVFNIDLLSVRIIFFKMFCWSCVNSSCEE